MKTWIKSLMTGLLTGLVILGSLPALAQPYDATISSQQMDQEHRIQQGVQSGQLTPGEYQRLEQEQALIRATEAQMWADGHLSPGERARLHRMLARSSQNIYDLKHNRWKVVPVN
jgi:hypothetical protein